MKKLFSIMSNLQTNYHFKLDFQIVDQHTGGKLLIHGNKHHRDNKKMNPVSNGVIHIIPKMFQDVPCAIADISWKFHENPFIQFTV